MGDMARTVLLVLGVLILVKGALLFANPKWMKKAMLELAHSKSGMRAAGIIAIVIGALIVFYTL